MSEVRTRWARSDVLKAIELRRKGHTFGEIQSMLGKRIAKSTLHYWVGKIERPKKILEFNRQKWIREVQPLGALANKKLRSERLRKINQDSVAELSLLQLTPSLKKTILAMLYWAEGDKGRGSLNIANTDPRLLNLFLSILREIFLIDETKMRLRLHIHDYHNEQKVKIFWSNLLKVPLTQFHKTFVKQRSKNKSFRKNSWGICFLVYHDVAVKDNILNYAHNLGDLLTKRD